MDYSLEDLDKIIPHLQKQKQLSLADTKNLYIVNAGNMNHGKSSLLNSILNSNEFKVADVRETSVNKTVSYEKNLYLIDTPGLGASLEDDEEAKNVYQKANFILYVHSVKIGELNSLEIDHLKELAEIIGKDYFWNHVALVLTFIEEYPNSDDLMVIVDKIKLDLKNNFDISDLPIFYVSNSRFAKSQQETDERKKKKFLEISGILAIRNFINNNKEKWHAENLDFLDARFEKLKEKFLDIISTLGQIMTDKLQYDVESSEKFANFWKEFSEMIDCKNRQLSELYEEKIILERSIAELENKHKEDKQAIFIKNCKY